MWTGCGKSSKLSTAAATATTAAAYAIFRRHDRRQLCCFADSFNYDVERLHSTRLRPVSSL